MDITVYLPDEIGRWAKTNDLPLSRMLRKAVEDERDRREWLKAQKGGATDHIRHVVGVDGDFQARIYGTVAAQDDVLQLFVTEDDGVYLWAEDTHQLVDLRGIAEGD